MSISETLQQDMKSALRAGAKLELSALRMAIAAIKKQEIDDRAPLSDAAAISLLEKMIKQGRDARQQFQAAGRDELAAKEAAEIAIFERYLPQPLAADELQALIADAVAGAQGMQDMGRIMAAIKAQAAGRCDMAEVGKRVREILASL